MANIVLKSLNKHWGEMVAVNDVNLEIHDEEFMVLLGPSGCGKTTTMRMIAGLTESSSGDIIIDGQNVSDVDARDRDVAMVFQSYALYPNMTLYENIRFPLRMRGIPKAKHPELIQQAAELVEIEDLLQRKPAALSGGQRQRAALARAIVRQPRAFLMDEPLSNLDAKLRSSMRVQLKHLQRQLKITTVYVTHDQIEAMTLADRVVIMRDGKIEQLGTPDEIYNNPASTFVAGFIGSPPMNLVACTLQQGTLSCMNSTLQGLPAELQGDYTLGFRPEDCRVAATGTEHVLKGTLYGLEPTGDQTILTVRLEDGNGSHMIEVKEDRSFRQALDTAIDIAVDNAHTYFFERSSGKRVSL